MKGEEIPLSARIVALADVYDALTSKRVYKSALAHEVAKSIIVGDKGTHFDPSVVDADDQLTNYKDHRGPGPVECLVMCRPESRDAVVSASAEQFTRSVQRAVRPRDFALERKSDIDRTIRLDTTFVAVARRTTEIFAFHPPGINPWTFEAPAPVDFPRGRNKKVVPILGTTS